ncbi:MAG: hypothetical protein H0X33_05120 [Taibaiella sp.]|nr:hypothetical protein [Taibaiella sp.]
MILILLFTGGIIWTSLVTIKILKTTAIDQRISDIIPTIQILCKRLLSGQYPYSYDALTSLYYHTPSGYLPMHWLPYTAAEYFKFDYRSITFCIWCIGALVVMFRSMRLSKLWLQVAVPVLLACSYYAISQLEPNIIGWTVEIMVAGYYMLFIAGINQKNPWITAFVITCCLLSRYSLVLWLPLWAFVMYVSGHRKDLIKAIIGIVVLVGIIYVIPFLSKDWSTFYVAHTTNYETIPIVEWRHQNKDGLPVHLYNGFGLAHLFYQKYHGPDLQHGYDLLKRTLTIATSGSLFIMGIWYWRNRKNIDYRLFLLGSFKIYLSIFFAFIMIPYMYLIMVGNFVSIALFAEQGRYKRSE